MFVGHVLRKLHGKEYPSSEEEESGSTGVLQQVAPCGSQPAAPVKSYTVTPPPADWPQSIGEGDPKPGECPSSDDPAESDPDDVTGQ